MILVSACLVGKCCKYSGGHNKSEAVLAYLCGRDYLPVCPEELGGLPPPRQTAVIVGGGGEDVLRGQAAVLDKSGSDVTARFVAGAKATLALAERHSIDMAILKERSPSCGVHQIYDGSFGGKVKKGRGVCAALLDEAGIKVFSDEDI